MSALPTNPARSVEDLLGWAPDTWRPVEFALAMLTKGCAVFPLGGQGGKGPLLKWREFAATDAARDQTQVRRWAESMRPFSFGVAAGESGLVVLDVDPRSGGHESLPRLPCQSEIAHTFQVKTPRGQHYYFKAPPNARIRNRAALLDGGIDVRGDGGYVVGPGSETIDWWKDGELKTAAGRYVPLDIERDFLPLPQPLADLFLSRHDESTAKAAEQRSGSAASASVLTTPNGDSFIPKGSRNDTLARIAGAMRRHGADASSIIAALREENRAHCRPPLPDTEVVAICRSIARYEPSDRPALVVPEIDLASRTSRWTPEQLLEEPPRRTFTIDPILPRNAVTAVLGQGGVGKSTLLASMAASIATGSTWHGHLCATGDVITVTAEDSPEDVRRQFCSLIASGSFDADAVQQIANRVHVVSLRGMDARFVETRLGGTKVTPLPALLADWINERCPAPRLVIVETLSRLLDADENANSAIASFVTSAEIIAERTGAAVAIVHHVAKGAARAKTTDQYAGRGGGALADNSRSVITMVQADPSMTDPPVPEGVPTDILRDRKLVLVRHAKSNYAAPADDLWLVRHAGPRFARFVPGSAPERAAAMLKRLVEFVASCREAAPRRPVTMKLLRSRCTELAIAQRDVEPVVQDAVAKGLLEVRRVRQFGTTGQNVLAVFLPGEPSW